MGDQVSGHWVYNAAKMCKEFVRDEQNNSSKASKTSGNDKSKPVFSDKNANGIVDKQDFTDDATLQLAIKRGIIGQSWSAVESTISQKLNSKNGTAVKTVKRYNEATKENYTAELNAKGQEARQIYYKADGSVDQYITFEYDKNGNPSRKVYCAADGTLQKVREYKDGVQVKYTDYNSDGTKALEASCNGNKITEMTEFSYNGKTITSTVYDADGKYKTSYINFKTTQ